MTLNTDLDSVGGGNMTKTNGNGSVFDDAAVSNSPLQTPIAICGMGMRLPGGIRNDLDLYSFLIAKKDARTTVPETRYNVDAYHSTHGKTGTVATRQGYFLEDVDFSNFDLSMFSMTAQEVCRLDPSQRLLLEVVREAFESAGESDFGGKNIGTFASVYSEDWQDLQNRDEHDHSPYELTGTLDFMLANRVAYEYDLKGPSVTLKAACASSAMALHQALQAIRVGEIPSAIVAGANLMLAPGLGITMSTTGLLSPDGSCKAFDASANGFARAEAVACLYVKRLDHAIRDGNPVRAVIRASASNSDGRTQGSLAFPNALAHEELVRQAYRNAGLDFCNTAMVECHGTGTAAGDPLEASAMANCFGERGVYIGSVKPNLGHSESVAGIVSVLKAVAALEHQTIIPNIKFVTPNPAIPWASGKLSVPTEPQPWPRDRCERMSVHSYGVGGSNVHLILDSPRAFQVTSPAEVRGFAEKRLLLFSANSAASLQAVADRHLEYLEKAPAQLESLAYTLAKRREHLKLRSFCVTDGLSPFKVINPAVDSGRRPGQVAFIFTGQGAQWVHMGRRLIQEYPTFREGIKTMDAIIQFLEHAPPWTIEDVLTSCEDESVITQPAVSQPVCTALQIALVNLCAAWGVTPAAVMGHSSGEIAAAYAAGALSMREALIVAFYRGHVCSRLQKRGGMAAVGMGAEDVQPYLVPGVGIACENSVSSVTLSGDIQSLEGCLDAIRRDKDHVLVRRLQVAVAYHSSDMEGVGAVYHDLIRNHVKPQAPQVPFISSVTGKAQAQAGDFGPEYWQKNLEMPVLFRSAAKRLLHESSHVSVHVEIGPHSALAAPLRQVYTEQGASIMYGCCLARGKDDVGAYLEAMGRLHCAGVTVSPVFSPQAKVLTHLPTYPWHYDQSYWAETRVMANWRHRQHGRHDLLGLRTLESPDLEPTWRNVLRLVDVPWLQDHALHNDVVLPAAGFVAMAGEAASQLMETKLLETKDALVGYTVRDVHLSKAMLLRDDQPTEVVTTLRPQRLTTTLDSRWYEFTVLSHGDNGWTRHCRGLVSSGRACGTPGAQVKTFSRKISPGRWYKTMARIGLNYGPRFQGLHDVTASVVDKVASARVTDRREDWESLYAMHPATLDAIFQSWTVAQTNGVHRHVTRLGMPTRIEELYVGCAGSAAIDLNTFGGRQGSSHGVVDGDIVVSLRGLEVTYLNDERDELPELDVQHLQWKPDFDFADHAKLMRPRYSGKTQLGPVERLFVLCAIEAKQQLGGVTPSQPHFARYLAWLDGQVERFGQPGYPLVEDSASLVELSSASREEMMADCLERIQTMDAVPLGMAVWRSYKHLAEILQGRTDMLDLFLQDGLLQQIYDWMNDLQDVTDLFRLLGNARPQLKVLEIGAGTGGLTSKVLSSLRSEYGERLYLSYTFTDVSSGFFVKAQDRFKDYSGVEYRVLDISRDPVQQGFGEAEYDLVVASNVLHATPSLVQTLRHCRKLLQPDGHLFLQELSPASKSANFVMGLFPGWWLGVDDGRLDEPYVSPEEWDARLRESGFDGISSVVWDGEAFNANMVAQPATETTLSKRVTLLTGPEGLGSAAQATQRIMVEEQGFEVDHCIWRRQTPPADQALISFVDLEGSADPLLKNIQEEDLSHLLQVLDKVGQASMLWLTKPAQINCEDPHNAQMLGMARTARAELGLHFATMELEHAGDGAAAAIAGVFLKLQRTCAQEVHGELDPDLEYAWRDGCVHLSRFHWFPVGKALAAAAAVEAPEAKRLVVGQCGMLQSLQWRAQGFGDVGPEQVRVRTRAVGMNFKEVLLALGVLATDGVDERAGGIDATGCEGVGDVTAVGRAVQHVQVGDRVMWGNTGLPGFATEVQLPGAWCVRAPGHVSDHEAATMVVAYYTVLCGLVDRANLQRGQSLLIHSAAGGVGIAAMHVARWLGADIYATVGTDEKVDFLMREFGLPRHRIFRSRHDSFARDVMAATGGVGVDVVLNSLSGELLHASWGCVAADGCMVEIGQRDVVGHGQLAMSGFAANRTFIGVDVSISFLNLSKTQRKLQQIVDLCQQGHIHPIRPITVFEAAHAEHAFRHMTQGQHVGKLVVTFPPRHVLPLAPTVPEASFRSDASYLLVGGMGGLGKAAASWMVACGARSLIFLSPSAGRSAADQQFLDELREARCHVQCYAGNVADAELVRAVVRDAYSPIAGLLQMAMVLDDVGLMDMDAARWAAATRPKVDGTWNLHRLLPARLDFFLLFSSMAGLFGHFGQANYASANAFLDAFVQYRHARQQVASVIDLGPIGEVGYVARLPGGVRTYSDVISEQGFLDVLHLAVLPQESRRQDHRGSYQNSDQIALAPRCTLSIADPQNTAIWKRDPRMAIYRNIERVSASSCNVDVSDTLRSFVKSLTSEPAILDDTASSELLARAIGARVSKYLMMKDAQLVDMSLSLAAMGVDSLVSIELRNWWRQAFGVDVSVLELMNGGSIRQLGDLAVVRLKSKHGAEKMRQTA